MEIGFEFWFTGTLLLLMTVFLIKEWLEVEVVLFLVLMFLVIGRVITLKEAFSGFSNEGMLTIALLFIVAGALNSSGILGQISYLVFGRNKTAISQKLLRILFPVSTVSAFINNTPLVAMLIPATRSWTEKHDYALSKYLIPISFAAILGGMCTLIGTSTNLIIHGLMIDYGMEGIGFFEITKIGLPTAILGILFISIFGYRLLPDRKEPFIELGEQTREYVIELKVTKQYQNIGKTIEKAGLRHLKGLFLFQIERGKEIIAPVAPEEEIKVGDRLFFTGIPKTILELQKTPGLQLTKDSHFDLKHYDSSEIKTFECVISHGSPLVGKTVRQSNFREKYNAVIIAIHRHGERIHRKIGDISLHAGDTLLLLSHKNFRKRWYHSTDFYLIADAESLPSRPQWQGYLSLGLFFGMVVLTALKIFPLVLAAGLVVIILVLSKCVSTGEARRNINWRVLLVIALSLGIASGVKNSGLGEVIGHGIVKLGDGFGDLGVLVSLYLITNFYTMIITSNATAAILFPVALSAAADLQLDPHAFAITLAIAAAASFASPISYQTNLMVYGPGGYKFTDFLKIGIPLQIVVGFTALVLIHYVYL